MKLHYSQTVPTTYAAEVTVSVPYEITLLSNQILIMDIIKPVSVPYEITLLSN